MTIKILSEKEIISSLAKLEGWTYIKDGDQGKISKEFKFKDFMDSLDFVNKLSEIFEKNDHHPDIHIFYNRIKFELQRFDVGGKVTPQDIETAKIIQEYYEVRTKK